MTDQAVGRIRCIDDEMTGGYFIAGQEYSLTRVGDHSDYAIDESGSEHKITSDFLAEYFEHVAPTLDKNHAQLAIEIQRKIKPPESKLSAHEYALANIAYVRKLAQEKALDVINVFIQSLGEVHLGDGIFITQADHDALQQMDAREPQSCSDCKKFIDHGRQNLGLDTCYRCSRKAVLKQIEKAKQAERGLTIFNANEAVRRTLTAHLREVKV